MADLEDIPNNNNHALSDVLIERDDKDDQAGVDGVDMQVSSPLSSGEVALDDSISVDVDPPASADQNPIQDEVEGAMSMSMSASQNDDASQSSFLPPPRVAPAAVPAGLNSPPPDFMDLAHTPVAHPPAAPSPASASAASSSSHAAAAVDSSVPPADASSSSSSSSSSSAPSPAVALVPLDLPTMRELPPIKLGRTPKERVLYEQLGDLYSLIVTMEHIELAYVRDAISEQAYGSTCQKLIGQYKTLRESMGSSAPDLDLFCKDYGLECRAGENRLRVGVPATVLHGGEISGGGGGGSGGHGGGYGGGGGNGNKMEVAVFHSVQHFITMMDSLKLNMRAVDELHPTLTELVEAISKVPGLPAEHESKTKTVSWLTILHQMKAHEELNEEQIRQMSFDLDSAYNAFHRFVQGK